MPKRKGLNEERDACIRAAVVHERAVHVHEEAAAIAREVGNWQREVEELALADKERRAAENARAREAAVVASLIAIGLYENRFGLVRQLGPFAELLPI